MPRKAAAATAAAPPPSRTKPQIPRPSGQPAAGAFAGGMFGVATGASPLDRLKPTPATIDGFRKMRRHPTIALARSVFCAPIRSASYTLEATRDADAPATKAILARAKAEVLPVLTGAFADLTYALDYGYQAFESVFKPAAAGGGTDLASLKMLLPELTSVVLDEAGGFDGLMNGPGAAPWAPTDASRATYLPAEYCAWHAHEREGDNWYGESVLERCRAPYDEWREYSEKRRRYLTMISAPIPWVKYPAETEAKMVGGASLPAYQVAMMLIDSLATCKGIGLPKWDKSYLMDMARASGKAPGSGEQTAWEVGILDPGPDRSGAHTEGLRHCEIQMVRAWLLPERAVLEGQHGTKAESGTQASLGLAGAELVSQDMGVTLSVGPLDSWLVFNYGEQARGLLRVKPEQTDPKKAELLSSICKALLGAPVNFADVARLMDFRAVFELLGIPATPELAAGKAEIPEAPEPTGEGAARSEDGAAKPGKATATPDPESAADLILGVKDPHTKYVKVPGERRRTSTLPDTRIKQQSAYEGPAGGQAALAREGAGNSTRPFAHGWAPRAATARP